MAISRPSLNNLANCLSALGRREEALAAAEEAATFYRQLAATRPDAFSSYRAGSLNNLAGRLSALERREEALAASE
jgi:tetratricopeptide (TPR) repeat protein